MDGASTRDAVATAKTDTPVRTIRTLLKPGGNEPVIEKTNKTEPWADPG